MKISDVNATKNSYNAVFAAVPKHREAAPTQPRLASAINGVRKGHVPAATTVVGRLATRPVTKENEKVKDVRRTDPNLDNVKARHDQILVVVQKIMTITVETADRAAIPMEVVEKPLLNNLGVALPLLESKTPKFANIISKANVPVAKTAPDGIQRNAAFTKEELAPLETNVFFFTGKNQGCQLRKKDPDRVLPILRRVAVKRKRRWRRKARKMRARVRRKTQQVQKTGTRFRATRSWAFGRCLCFFWRSPTSGELHFSSPPSIQC